MITPSDLYNPTLKSGFHGVRFEDYPGRQKPYVAEKTRGGGRKGMDMLGPHRETAIEAARDYCIWHNHHGATPATRPKLKAAGHQYNVTRVDDAEYQAAIGVLRDFKAQRAGKQGYVYLITDSEYVKIGYSVNPAKRVAELQTGNARLLRVLATMQGTTATELTLHARFEKYNTLQEWFELHEDILTEFCDEHGRYINDHIKDNA